ncbi:MAG TPA: ribbon-helix-helix protein, CopG family [Polyangiaceae bacterium]|jgi:metal-responsive CopG/Arc/MetJ family transcriptional regulator|nr:ribbon-helix-helix protein, CopG family [Polyangiaceae bacterium]
MGVHKFAISIPVEVMEQIDEAAARRGVTRSRFISDVLRQAARARSDAEITRRLDEVFSDPEVTREQRRTSREFLAARVRDDAW